jgi:hypothetical protein
MLRRFTVVMLLVGIVGSIGMIARHMSRTGSIEVSEALMIVVTWLGVWIVIILIATVIARAAGTRDSRLRK